MKTLSVKELLGSTYRATAVAKSLNTFNVFALSNKEIKQNKMPIKAENKAYQSKLFASERDMQTGKFYVIGFLDGHQIISPNKL